jgi:4-amino-4-deoxy-L-arabinose transferase-like glycosyltransferase
MKKLELLILIFILLGAFAVRLYKFDGPIADWHSWRQADTSAVSRNFVKFGYDILFPRFDDLSNGVSLLDNPRGYRFVEFPFYNMFQAGAFQTFGSFTIEEWGRLVSIFSSLGAIFFLFLLVKKHVSTRAGLIAAFFYAFVPYNIYYGRTILPDTLMVMAFLGGLYFFDEWLDENSKLHLKSQILFLSSIIFTASALLIKPFVAFFFLAFLYLVFMKYGWRGFIKPEIWVFFIVVTLPFMLWRMWMQSFPEGIPRNDWLYNWNNIRFKGSFYWWLFAERISKLILGYWGLGFVVLGFLFKPFNREKFLFFIFVVSVLIYFHVFATGNVQHDYYQILIVPTVAIFFAKGVDGALNASKQYFSLWATRIMIGVSVIFMLMFGWYEVRDFYSIQHPDIVIAGHAVDELTPKDAKVVAPYNGDTAFLYQTNRQGWPVFERSFQQFIISGATHIAFANPTKEELNIKSLFEPVKITDRYAIFDLSKPSPLGIEELKKEE